jgi:hypothetical protein
MLDGNEGCPDEQVCRQGRVVGHHSQAFAGIDTSKSRNAAAHRRRELLEGKLSVIAGCRPSRRSVGLIASGALATGAESR